MKIKKLKIFDNELLVWTFGAGVWGLLLFQDFRAFVLLSITGLSLNIYYKIKELK